MSSTMLAHGGKYDNYHLHDHQFNRKLVYRFLRGAITFHLKYVEIMSKQEDLRYYVQKFISNEQDRVAAVHLFPTMVQFRLALLGTQEVMQSLAPEKKTATPAQVFDEADEEILMWVHAGILEANEEATREGRPQPTTFTDEEMSSIVPVDPSLEDADTEEQRARIHLQEDLNQAIEEGFSVATDESIELEPESTEGFEDDLEIVPEVDDWDLIADDKIIVNPYDEKVKEDAIADERAKEVEDLNKILEITSTGSKPSGTTAADVVTAAAKEASTMADEEGDKMKSSGISAVSMVGDAEVIPSDMTSSRVSTWSVVGDSGSAPMDVDAEKKDDDATRKGEPNIATASGAASSSEKPAEDKTEIVDLTKKTVEVDKPVGRPAEKKMPKSEKQKAPESKAMPRPKAPRLSVEADAALKNWKRPLRSKKVQFGLTLRTWRIAFPVSIAARAE